MPSVYDPYKRQYPGQGYTLKHAAKDGQLIVIRCAHCRRSACYLATDLTSILDAAREAALPPFPCSKCGRYDYISVTLRLPQPGDYGSLDIRRPAGIKRTQMWKTVKLGD